MLLLFNKPYGVLSQFTPEGRWQSLAAYIDVPDVYAAGRLDADSEGLLLLTDNAALKTAIASNRAGVHKTYLAQVEGIATETHTRQLRDGVLLRDGPTRPARCRVRPDFQPGWPRHPPIRVRQHIPDSWIELVIDEGRNRQVRRMTAHVGLPTLRLIRTRVGPWGLEGLMPGEYRLIDDRAALAALRLQRARRWTAA
ncbi:MAG: pseudouridine synthase [Lautropia sp.]|nr:pseudouridine synthase [Lautropia sp.]